MAQRWAGCSWFLECGSVTQIRYAAEPCDSRDCVVLQRSWMDFLTHVTTPSVFALSRIEQLVTANPAAIRPFGVPALTLLRIRRGDPIKKTVPSGSTMDAPTPNVFEDLAREPRAV